MRTKLSAENRKKITEYRTTIDETERALLATHKLHKTLRQLNSYEHTINYTGIIKVIEEVLTTGKHRSRHRRNNIEYIAKRTFDGKIEVTFNHMPLNTAADRYMNTYITKLKLIGECKRNINRIEYPNG